MSRTISPKAKRRGRGIAERGFVTVTKSAEGGARHIVAGQSTTTPAQ